MAQPSYNPENLDSVEEGNKPTLSDDGNGEQTYSPDNVQAIDDYSGVGPINGVSQEKWSPWDQGGYARTSRGLYRYLDPQGNEVISKNVPPAGTKPPAYKISANDSPESDPFSEGVGQSFMKTARGSKEFALDVLHHYGVVSDKDHAKYRQHIKNAADIDADLEKTTGGKLGNFVGSAAQTWAVPGTVLKQTLGQGVFGAMQPVQEGESRTLNAGISAGAAGLTSLGMAGISRLVQPVKGTLDEAGQEALKTFNRLDIPADVAQQTGSKVAESLKTAAGENPFIGQSSFANRQSAAITREALKTAGVTSGADIVTQDVLNTAHTNITNALSGVAKRNPISIVNDPAFGPAIQGIFDEAAVPGVIGSSTKNTIDEIRQRLIMGIDKNNQSPTFGEIKSSVSAGVRRTISGWSKTGDPDLKFFGGKLAEVLDDAVGRSAAANNPGDSALLAAARDQFRNFEKLTDPGVIDQKTGRISVNALFNKFKNTDLAQRGKGPQDLWELSKAAATIVPDKIGNSGTARRIAATVGLGALGYTAGQALTGDPWEAAKYAGLGIALPWASQKFIQGDLTRKWVGKTAYSPTASAIAEDLVKVGGSTGATAVRNIIGPLGIAALNNEDAVTKHTRNKKSKTN